jgi:hypothetical protein
LSRNFICGAFRDPGVDPRTGARVWVADFERKSVDARSPRKIERITDYYSFDGTKAGPPSDFVETHIVRRVESLVAPIVIQPRDGNCGLTDRNRGDLA